MERAWNNFDSQRALDRLEQMHTKQVILIYP